MREANRTTDSHRWVRSACGLGAAIVCALLAGVPGIAHAATQHVYPHLFGTREVRSTNLAPFPKWTGLLDRYFGEREITEGSCTATSFNRCHLDAWHELIGELKGVDPATQLDRVNRFMNEAPYITDPRNYSLPDYWATPRQFFNRNGDCEDYAIAKFMTLRALGWPNRDMRIVVLQDLNLRIPHAILVVYRDGVAWVLDNQIEQVVTADRIRHYRPLYSVNEDSWWLHRP
ncbi:MAG: transglutaminase-like cysteine peptidase [Alphaproteobacteria bacterium]